MPGIEAVGDFQIPVMPNNLFYGFKRFTCELLFWNFIFVVLVGIDVNASLWKISALAGIRAVARQASFGGGAVDYKFT